MVAYVESLAYGPAHNVSKTNVAAAALIEGLGVKGDDHAGSLVKHRSRVKADPNQPNLRQVHIIRSELLEELATQGVAVSSADLG